MEKTIFITILVLAFCFVSFAQDKKQECPKIEILSPYSMQQGDLATFIIEVNGKTDKELLFDWEIFKDGKKTLKQTNNEITVDSTDILDLIVTAKLANNKKCNETAAKGVLIEKVKPTPIIACYFPDEYNFRKGFTNRTKALLDNWIMNALVNEGMVVTIALGINKTTDANFVKNHIVEFLKYAKSRKLKADKIQFLLFGNEKETALMVNFHKTIRDFPLSNFDKDKQITGKELNKFLPKELIK